MAMPRTKPAALGPMPLPGPVVIWPVTPFPVALPLLVPAAVLLFPLVVVGSEDAQFLAAADVMTERIPGARKVVLAGAGHAANIDAPEEFNAAVSDFLGRL